MSPAFDKDELMDRVDGDLEFLAESVEMLDEDAGPLLEQIREAASAGDAAALVKPAHTLKGMLLNFCAEAAGDAALELETRAREGHLEGIDAVVQTVTQETDRLRTDLHAFVGASE